MSCGTRLFLTVLLLASTAVSPDHRTVAMLIRRIDVRSMLSFGPQGLDLPLRPLNLLIGPNGSGKSNLLECLALLKALPRDLPEAISKGGSAVRDWIWGGQPGASEAGIEVILESSIGPQHIRFVLKCAERRQGIQVTEERIEYENPFGEHESPYLIYDNARGHATINYQDNTANGKTRRFRLESIDDEQSILSQRKDPDHYPVLTYLGDVLSQIRLYREWKFGRDTMLSSPQKTDLPNDFLREDGSNLGLVLNSLRRTPKVKRRLLRALRQLYEGITDFEIIIEGNTVQKFFEEGDIVVPATRMSSGTLRYLCLLAILCHPKPPPLVCIEAPELGLHPDVLPTLSELLLEASDRAQWIVTTHSDVLVDALSEHPEYVVVCEKRQGQTEMRRLVASELVHWLEHCGLGELWQRGEIGGNRW